MGVGRNIGNLLRQRRASAKELSHAVGIPASTISKWVNSDQEPKADALLKVARFFGVSIEELILGEPAEVAAVRSLLGELEERFVEVHQGVYRVRIEKQIQVPKIQGGKK